MATAVGVHPVCSPHREAQGLEQKLVSHHVHSQLLVTEAVEAGSAGAGGGADLAEGVGSAMMGICWSRECHYEYYNNRA